MLEENLRRTLLLAEGGWQDLLMRPGCMILAVLLLVVCMVPAWQRWRRSARGGETGDG